MTLCHALVCYLISFVYMCLNCVFLLRGSRITDATPSPTHPQPWPAKVLERLVEAGGFWETPVKKTTIHIMAALEYNESNFFFGLELKSKSNY